MIYRNALQLVCHDLILKSWNSSIIIHYNQKQYHFFAKQKAWPIEIYIFSYFGKNT